MLLHMLKMLAGSAPKNAMLDTMLAALDKEIWSLPELVLPSERSEPRNSFTSTIPEGDLSVATLTPRQRLALGPTMLSLVSAMRKSAGFYERRPATQPGTTAEPGLLAMVEELAREHGASALSTVTIPDDAIFAGLALPHRNAIVYTVQMAKEPLDSAPSFEAFHEVAKGYLRLARIGNAIAELLRAHGHAAYPGTALGGLSDYSRIAELAGLGAIGYHGLLITEQDGALLRINTIYVSFAVPAPPEPPTWIRDFCSMCRKCVRRCPPKAIHDRPIERANGRVQCINTTACLDYFAANYGCAICADTCPFTQIGYAAVKRRFRGNADAPTYSISRHGACRAGAVHSGRRAEGPREG